MQKKAKAPEPAGESAPMWIVSFADLVVLMMSFFVVLYALKQGGEDRQMSVAAAIRATFDPNYIPSADSTSEFDQRIRMHHGLLGPSNQNFAGNATRPTEGAAGRDEQVTTIRPGKQIVTGGKITFDLNDVGLDDASRETLVQIARRIRGKNNVLFIKGHVSVDEPHLRPDDVDGIDLSYRRALRVADELAALGIDRRVMRPLACGPFEPIKTGVYDTSALRQNRRVEVFTTETTASEYLSVPTVQAIPDVPPALVGAADGG